METSEKGDEVLKSTGEILLENIRVGDLAVRHGREEILVVVPTGLHTGVILAESLRHAQQQGVRGHKSLRDAQYLEVHNAQPCKTFSIGIDDVARSVVRSDRALYFPQEYRQKTKRVSE